MSLEKRIAQMRSSSRGEIQPHTLIAGALKQDSETLFIHFKHNGKIQTLDAEVADIYELNPTDLPDFALANNLSFVAGFSYVASHWYPLVRAIASGAVATGNEQFMDSLLAERFPDANATTQHVREALAEDSSGVPWLEQMARVTFRQENLELLGVRKALTGVRSMYAALLASRA